jgi:hypothetical protein
MPSRDWIRLQGGLEIGQEGFRPVEPLHHVEVCSGLLRALQVLQAGGCLVSLALLGPEVRAQLPWLLAEERRLRVAGMVELST